jgi:DNA polymerase III alpha subunit
MPDFDIDFCQEKRDAVIRYVQDRYGHDRVAQIITFGKLQARAVLRDVGRVLEMPYGQVDRICKLVPNNPANPVTLEKAIDGEPQLQSWRDTDESVARLLRIGLKLEGLYRHASTHAAGVVIGDRPLDELVPLYRDPRSTMPVTQFNMKFVELAGLVKFDFLGLKTLTVLARAEELIRARGDTLDLVNLPLDDPPTYEMLSRGDAMGVFQFESSGMRDLLREAKPQNIEDLIALVALYRPGPMENIPKYIPGVRRLHARRRRPAAPRHGQEDQGGDGRAARHLRQGRDGPRGQRRARELRLRSGRQVRRLRLQQGAFGVLRLHRLSDRVSEGQLPGRVLRRVDDARSRQHRQAQHLPPGAPAPRRAAAAAGHQLQ